MSDPLPPSIETVCEQALRLPCSPALLPRLTAVLAVPKSSADDIADIIKIDSSLAASTLRLANSAYFATETPSETVTDAVIRLGQRELYRLAALALVSRWEVGTSRSDPGDFCRNALCTALAAEVLAETTERIDPQMAYTAGLVCDIGRLAVAHACASFFPAVRDFRITHGGTWSDGERSVLGYTHSEVGSRLLQAWSFPPTFAMAAQFCENPSEAPEESLPLVAHLHAAKYIATSFGPGAREDGIFFELNTPLMIEWGFTSELLQETMSTVHDRAKVRLQNRLTHGSLAF